MSELVYYDLKQSSSMTPSMPIQVARELGRRIVAGHYEAGVMLDEENTLAERYKVSRVVIRDAVKILVGKGMLVVRRGIGTKVRSRDQWTMLDDDVLAWHLSAPPNFEFLKQLMDIRTSFEPKAARWAAERGTDDDIEEIRKAYLAMEDKEGSVQNFVIADAIFHHKILIAAHNEFLKSIEGVIYSALLVSIKITNTDPRSNEKSVPYHKELYQAIAARDGETAEKMAETLLNHASSKLAKHMS